MPLHNRSKAVIGSRSIPQDQTQCQRPSSVLEEDSELRRRRLLLVSGSQDTESVGRVDMDDVGPNVEQEELPHESDSEEGR